MKNRVARRRYSPKFKQDALELAEKIGVSNVAGKFNISLSCLQRWKCQKNIPIKKSQYVLKLQKEVKRLKKKLAEEKATVEILKKATAFLSKRLGGFFLKGL